MNSATRLHGRMDFRVFRGRFDMPVLSRSKESNIRLSIVLMSGGGRLIPPAKKSLDNILKKG